ncbi:MAG: DNA polymerase III, partial [Nitrospirae bacterium RIFCSPHIGHO2_02_FULL_40_19]
PGEIFKFMEIPGVGPRTAKLLYEELKIKDIEQLKKLALAHKVAGLPGLKEKTEENILRGIELIEKQRKRMDLGQGWPVAQEIINGLKILPEVKKISPAGSLRRMRETIRDIDILVTSNRPAKVMEAFVKLPLIKEVLAHGPTKSSAVTKEGVQVDIRVVEPSSYGAALVYFTGSKEHNVQIRKMANQKGLKINEYGVFSAADGSASGGKNKYLAGKTEEEVYQALKLPFIPPELREDRGEIDAALKGKLPKLVELKDIKGDFHIHTQASDGAHSLEELVEAAREKDYEYIVICDHSASLPIAGGLSAKEVLKEIEAIRKLNKKLKRFRVLAGVELEILTDGKIDYNDNLLKEFDVVIAAIHSGFKQPKEVLTNRIIQVMESKYVNIIAHPTGRLFGVRNPYPLDFDKIFKTAKETNTFMEINAYPQRLDLNDENIRLAKDKGVGLVISTDTHQISQLDNMIFGVATA